LKVTPNQKSLRYGLRQLLLGAIILFPFKNTYKIGNATAITLSKLIVKNIIITILSQTME